MDSRPTGEFLKKTCFLNVFDGIAVALEKADIARIAAGIGHDHELALEEEGLLGLDLGGGEARRWRRLGLV